MERRPPLDDKALLKLLEDGQGQSEAARTLGYPVGTVTARVKKLRDRGILKLGNEVDFEALEAWEAGHRAKGFQAESAIPRIAELNTDEMKELRELLTWWRDRKRNTLAIPERNTHRTRRTYWIEDALHEAVKERADREGISQAVMVNRALRAYLTTPDH